MKMQRTVVNLLVIALLAGAPALTVSADEWWQEVIEELERSTDFPGGNDSAAVWKTPYAIYPGYSSGMDILVETDMGVDNDHKHIYIDLNPSSECDGDHGSDCGFGYTKMVIDLESDRRLWTFACRGLEPDHYYEYKVCVRDTVASSWDSYWGSFHTAPQEVTPGLGFFVYGDTRGTSNDISYAIWRDYQSEPSRSKFVIHTGDIVFRGGRVCHWDGLNFVDPWLGGFWASDGVQKMLGAMPIFTTIGNHDFDTDDFDEHPNGVNNRFYYRYFKYLMYDDPEPLDQDDGLGDFYYSFRWGPATFFSLTTYPMEGLCHGSQSVQPGTKQYDWLESELQSMDGNGMWKVVFMHVPVYACNCEVWEVRQYLVPLFEKYGVDVVLSGHAHYYSRATHNGIPYIVAGGGGAPLEDLDYAACEERDYIDTAVKKHQYTAVAIDHDYMVIDTKDKDGKRFDRVIIDKSPKADFDVQQGGEPREVTFTDQTKDHVIGWEWDFDSDGIVDSTTQNPTHIYPAGTNDATATLTSTSLFNSCSRYTKAFNVPVAVSDDPPSPVCLDAWTSPYSPGSVPGWFGYHTQGAGIAVADVDGNGVLDLIAFHVNNADGGNLGYYRIGWNVRPGEYLGSGSWTDKIEIREWFGDHTQGAGIAVADVDGNGVLDLITFHIDNPHKGNHGYYRIGWNLGSDGFLDSGSWTDHIAVPGWFGDETQGAGIAVGDVDGNGVLDLITFHIDNPDGGNHGYYRIGWNLGSDGFLDSGSWTDPAAVPGWYGGHSQGGGIAVGDVAGNGRLDLIPYHIDNPPGENTGYYRTSTDVQEDGRICSICSSP